MVKSSVFSNINTIFSIFQCIIPRFFACYQHFLPYFFLEVIGLFSKFALRKTNIATNNAIAIDPRVSLAH